MFGTNISRATIATGNRDGFPWTCPCNTAKCVITLEQASPERTRGCRCIKKTIRASYTTLWGFRTRTRIALTSDIRQRQVPLAFKRRPQGYSPSPAASVKKDPAPGRADSFERAGAEHIGSPDSLFASAQGAW